MSTFDVRDLIIKGSGNNQLKVHRCMVLARAPELYKELRPIMQERERGKFYVTLDSFDWKALYNFIRYLYFDTIAVEQTGEGGTYTSEEIDTINKIKDLAVRYKIERLEKLCTLKLGELVEVPDSTTSADLATIFNKEETSDVRLKINGEFIIPAHKCILATRCPYFKGMFESGMEESERSEIEIPEETTLKAFMQLVEYLYTDNIDELDGETAMEVYALANRYALDHLQALCEQVIRESVDEQNAEDVKKWAEAFGNPNLSAFCDEKINNRDNKTSSNPEPAK
eukprot:GEZU01006519.1.p1 GENE.GEZU01006519.1~~GEZU01006519.1.p1  ORF type:complete len:284 (+),score=105.46 GEZU01006519.1:259-1110(+)